MKHRVFPPKRAAETSAVPPVLPLVVFEAHDSDPRLSTIRRYALAVGAHVEHRVHRVDDSFDPVVAWHHEPAAQPMTIEVSVAGMVREQTAVPAEDYRGYGLAS